MNGFQETELSGGAPIGSAQSAVNADGWDNSTPQVKASPALVKSLESILTIDGQGRPAKARQLLTLLSEPGLRLALEELGKRKFF